MVSFCSSSSGQVTELQISCGLLSSWQRSTASRFGRNAPITVISAAWRRTQKRSSVQPALESVFDPFLPV